MRVRPGKSITVRLGQLFDSTFRQWLYRQCFWFCRRLCLSVLQLLSLPERNPWKIYQESPQRDTEWLKNLLIISHSDLQWPTGDDSLNVNKYTVPLGRKSRPTICWMRLLFPELCDPTTTILGSCIYCSSCMSLNLSMSETTERSCPPIPLFISPIICNITAN